MVEKFSQELGKKIEGVKAVIGQVPDYIELVFQHLDKTKDYLFGAKYNYDYARTKTRISSSRIGSSRVAIVGDFGEDDGLVVNGWSLDGGGTYVHVAPLVVPA